MVINKLKYLDFDIQRFADGEITYKVTLDSDGAIKSMEKIEKTADKTSKKADELANKFKSVGTKMKVGLTVPITAFGTYAVKMASDLNEVQNVVDTTFENSSETINKFAKSAAEQFGISELSAKQFTGTMGAMLKSMGLGNKDITDMSIALSGLAGDMASFYNLDPEEAFEKLRAGISGETEPLKQLGINMSVVNLEAFAMSKGITKSYDSMTQAEQATLRYQYIMETTADAQGDYSKTADSTANKTRTTMLQFQTLSAELGQQLLPIVNDVLGALQSVIKWFNNLDASGKRVVLILGGIALAIGPVTTAIGTLIKVGSGIKSLVTIIKSWNVVTKLMTVAQGALNAVMNMNPISLIIIAIVALIAIIAVLWNKCEWFRDGVMAVINVVVSFFQNLWSSIVSIASSIWNTIVSIANSIWNVIQTILNYLQVPIDFIKNILLLIVAIVATVLETIYNTVVTIIQSILSFFGTIAGWIYENVLLPVYNFFANIFNAIYNTIASFINTVFSIFSTVANWIYTNVLQPIFNFFSNIFNAIWNVISKVIDNIKNAFQAVGNFIKSVFEGVKSVISTIINTIVNIIKAPINALIGFVNAIIKGLNKIKVPDWVPGIGGMGINIPLIPKLATGTNYVKAEGLAYLHEGEAVVPKKYNPAVGGYEKGNQPIYVTVNADMDVNKFGKAFVKDIKTFSGGSKNSYNYGGSK